MKYIRQAIPFLLLVLAGLIIGCSVFYYARFRADRALSLAYTKSIGAQLGANDSNTIGIQSFCRGMSFACSDVIIFVTNDSRASIEQRLKQVEDTEFHAPSYYRGTLDQLGMVGLLSINLREMKKPLAISRYPERSIELTSWTLRDQQRSRIDIHHFAAIVEGSDFVVDGNTIDGDIVQVTVYYRLNASRSP